MTAPKPKLTARERKLANRAAGGRANAATTAWVLARRKRPGLTLHEFEVLRDQEQRAETSGSGESAPGN